MMATAKRLSKPNTRFAHSIVCSSSTSGRRKWCQTRRSRNRRTGCRRRKGPEGRENTEERAEGVSNNGHRQTARTRIRTIN
eukprot:2922021-Rhodomonas_salina.1